MERGSKVRFRAGARGHTSLPVPLPWLSGRVGLFALDRTILRARRGERPLHPNVEGGVMKFTAPLPSRPWIPVPPRRLCQLLNTVRRIERRGPLCFMSLISGISVRSLLIFCAGLGMRTVGARSSDRLPSEPGWGVVVRGTEHRVKVDQLTPFTFQKLSRMACTADGPAPSV